MTTTPTALVLRALRVATRRALTNGVTPVEIIDAVAREIYHPSPGPLPPQPTFAEWRRDNSGTLADYEAIYSLRDDAPHCRHHLEFRSDCAECAREREWA